MSRAGRLVLWAVAGAVALGGLGLLRATALAAGREDSWCVYRRATAMPCPGCGLTRSADRLAAGDLAGAVRAHPLGPVLALEGILAWLAWGAWAAGRLRAPGPGQIEGLALGHLALLVALWLGRAATGTLPW